MHGSWGRNRQLWLHHYVEVVTGELQPMHHENADGSIDVLGAVVQRVNSSLSFGSFNRDKMQQSVAEHAEKLKAAGATIVKKTKNRLVARYGNETAYYVISPLSAKFFYDSLDNKS